MKNEVRLKLLRHAVVIIMLAAVFFSAAFCNVSASAQTAQAFLNSAFDMSYVTVYSGSDVFNIGGRTYSEGVKFDSQLIGYAGVSFDVSGIDSLSFRIGHADNEDDSDSTFYVYTDGGDTEILERSLTVEKPFIQVDALDLSDVSVLTLRVKGGGHYGMVDICADGEQTDGAFTVPEYGSADDFLNSGFDLNYAEVYSGDSEESSVKINGREYARTVVFEPNFIERASVSFNVENTDSVSFLLGTMDDNYEKDGELEVYGDGEFVESYTVTQKSTVQKIKIDVSSFSVLRLRTSSGLKCAAVNFTINGEADESFTSPGYGSPQDFVKNAFNSGKIDVYDGINPDVTFAMSDGEHDTGIVFKPNLIDDSCVYFNTDSTDELAFTLGAVSDGGIQDGEQLNIYKDYALYRSIDLTQEAQSYVIDTSDTSVLGFTYGGDSQIGMIVLSFGGGEIPDTVISVDGLSAPETESSPDDGGTALTKKLFHFNLLDKINPKLYIAFYLFLIICLVLKICVGRMKHKPKKSKKLPDNVKPGKAKQITEEKSGKRREDSEERMRRQRVKTELAARKKGEKNIAAVEKYLDGFTEKNKGARGEMPIPDFRRLSLSAEELYVCAVLFEKRHTYDYEKYAILTYAAAAKAGSRKALYTLVNMAVDNTEYFIGD